MKRFDVAVLGCGGVGSAVLRELAFRGLRAVGVDRFRPPHDRGSSHGQTRAIRQAYFEHPMYVPLLRRAYALWESLEQQCQRQLYFPVGLLEAGPADGIVVPGVLASAAEHDLPVQTWTIAEAAKRVPGIQLDESMQVVFEENAGYLLVEDCVEACIELALAHGASLWVDEVQQLSVDQNCVRIRTSNESFEAGACVITAGSWARDLVRDATEQQRDLPLSVVRKHLHWRPSTGGCRVDEGFPVFFVEEPEALAQADTSDTLDTHTRFFYGFPQLDDRGVKVAEHSGASPVADPLSDPRESEAEDTARVEDFVRRRLPNVHPEGSAHASCFYTMTPDGHFIVDRAPGAKHVAFAAGLSGHGFKFASALGETLCQLALGETTSCDVTFLRADRFAE